MLQTHKTKKDSKHYADWLLCLWNGKFQIVSDAAYSDVLQLPSNLCVELENAIINHV